MEVKKNLLKDFFRKALSSNLAELKFPTRYNVASACQRQPNEMKSISESDYCWGQKLVNESDENSSLQTVEGRGAGSPTLPGPHPNLCAHILSVYVLGRTSPFRSYLESR